MLFVLNGFMHTRSITKSGDLKVDFLRDVFRVDLHICRTDDNSHLTLLPVTFVTAWI